MTVKLISENESIFLTDKDLKIIENICNKLPNFHVPIEYYTKSFFKINRETIQATKLFLMWNKNKSTVLLSLKDENKDIRKISKLYIKYVINNGI